MEKVKIAVLVSGGGTNLQAIFDACDSGLITSGQVELVIASNDRAYALKRAEARGVRTLVCSKKELGSQQAAEQAMIRAIRDCGVGLVVLAGYLSILSGEFIRHFEGKIINIHPSLIPAFCGVGCYGLEVHRQALARGVKVTGATVHYVNQIPDGGPIIAQKAVAVQQGDTPETLQRRVMEQAEWIILPAAIQQICAGAE